MSSSLEIFGKSFILMTIYYYSDSYFKYLLEKPRICKYNKKKEIVLT